MNRSALAASLWLAAAPVLAATGAEWTAPFRLAEAPAVAVPPAAPAGTRDPALRREVADLIAQAYYEPVDRARLDAAGSVEEMLALLDPHSVYQDPDAFLRLWKRRQFGYMAGVGVLFENYDKKTGDPLVVSYPLLDSPAERAGIQPGDRITKINGTDLRPLTFDEAVSAFQGEYGTPAALEFEDGRVLNLVRDRVRPDTFAGALLPPDGKVGYLSFAQFSLKSAGRTAKKIMDLREKGAKALIIDLRHNTGGEVEAAVLIASLFLKEGTPVVALRGRGHEQILKTDIEGPFQDLPLAVLTDHGTLSASEILAGALQDHRRATIVGGRSGGKGSMQMSESLSNGGAIMLTTHLWYTPSGRSINKTANDPGGIEPDAPVAADNPTQMKGVLALLRSGSRGGRMLDRLPADPVLREADRLLRQQADAR